MRYQLPHSCNIRLHSLLQRRGGTTMAHPYIVKKGNSPFKDERNTWILNGLFFETAIDKGKKNVRFTLAECEHMGLPSLREIYLSYDHVPGYEYDFANEVLGGWIHWNKLCKTSTIGGYIKEWREEKTVQLKAKALKSIIKSVSTDDKNAHQAAKFLSDKGWIEKSGKGRPSKEEKARALKEDMLVKDELDEDLKRIGLH